MRMSENFENHIFSQHFDGLFLIYIRFIIHKYDDKISLRLKIAKLSLLVGKNNVPERKWKNRMPFTHNLVS